MYKRPTQRLIEQDHRQSFSRSRSQYLKENWNPNTIQSQMSLLNLDHSSSINNIKKNEKRRSSLTTDEEIKSTKKKGSIKNIGLKYDRARGSQANIIGDAPIQVKQPSKYQPIQEDFIRPQDIGMNSKAVHHQLQNAMQRQIERQKAEIVALNSTIAQLKMKDKGQVAEIQKLNNMVAQLEFKLLDQSKKKQMSSARSTDSEGLREENQRLKAELEETQQMVKKILLERQKERVFTFHN